MPQDEPQYSSLPPNPNNLIGASENEAPGKKTAKFIRRIRCAADKCFFSRCYHSWWLGITVLTPLFCAVVLIVAHCIFLPQRLEDADVYVYWTYNCTGYANSTEPFQEWTSTCKTGPIAKPVVEHELLSMARECSMNMTTDFPMSRVQGRFSVQCVRQEGFETVPADADALLKVILLF
ncbi:hypothetical protein AAVH_33106, partial [Aphelenchoides avenae]